MCCALCGAGCATPQYTVRPTPEPNESAQARQIEQTISAAQAKELERNGVRLIRQGERLFGFDVQRVVNSLSRVTERPGIQYRVLLQQDTDPNAAALADGRIYVTTGLLNYLASRGSKPDELAFILGHELAHTAAQHLVKRYEQLRQQQLMVVLVGLGASAVTKNAGAKAQQLGSLAQDAASLVSQAIASGYSQEDELEADQLGIRYCIRAGYDPWAAVSLLEDFERFEVSQPFLRSHPYIARRRQDLERYLLESGYAPSPSRLSASPASGSRAQGSTFLPASGRVDLLEQRARLLEAQRLYPAGSQSWKNLKQQLDELDRRR